MAPKIPPPVCDGLRRPYLVVDLLSIYCTLHFITMIGHIISTLFLVAVQSGCSSVGLQFSRAAVQSGCSSVGADLQRALSVKALTSTESIIQQKGII